MGFPVGYSDLILPKLLFHLLTLLGIFRNLLSSFFRSIGLDNFLEPDFSSASSDGTARPDSVSAVLIRELLPVVKFSDLDVNNCSFSSSIPESCAVCLYEFDDADEIRTLTNCRHIFHRSCVDRWMDHEQTTCPLCRTPFIPDDMQDDFNERLWAASGIDDYYGEPSPPNIGL